ncbi:DUF1592 domain-containing protein [Candidatus Palauibacter soopunensis]|uniref:DUF1592 domain-containing protein n=1 Tax=Candidatus Palauibacter soopunensis TaxID=3056739 RepID=UPI00238B4534|nr:DUF1592 domain-containing protein [Candidatus Palauibacter soopunensis]MDE2877376.1 DUF1592 domain-containing protein [Candidatus Palauibacter soopunensis]
MRTSLLLLVAAGVLPSPAVGQEADGARGTEHLPTSWPQPITQLTPPTSAPAVDTLSAEVAQAVVAGTCMRCHNPRRVSGGMSLETFEAASAADNAVIAERMVRKLRAGMMPPVGVRRPTPDSLRTLAAVLESRLDAAWEASPNPGRRTFQRLNRAEYSRSIYDLLDLDIDAGDYLPLDTKSANFDNIADVQLLSPTLMDGYLRAASEISRLAIGDPEVTPSEATFRVSRWTSQAEHVEGTPYGSRGGVAVDHNFPADGEYVFRASFHHETTGALFGNGKGALHTTDEPERIEISIDGERVALLDIDRWMHVSDPDGVNLRTEPVFIEAGPHRVAAAFIRTFEGPSQDLMSPHDWSIASTSITDAYGFTTLPHLRDLAVTGPFAPAGMSSTPSRERVFSCRPSAPNDEASCAEAILSRLGTRAYRRPLTDDNLAALMTLYRAGADAGGFEEGIRLALEGILASPHFVFRFEERPAREADGVYALDDYDLASRLSFFLWATGPDDELLAAAAEGRLSDPVALDAQVRRMLGDPRAEALATRFAGQWFRLQDLEGMNPDVRLYPDFDQQLKEAMHRETELLFHTIVQEDRSLLELLTADYTFVNERLARHYGIPGVTGTDFRRVEISEPERRGVLGHGSILTLTSHASRTSPVLRGKWVMEVLLGTPPPPPPPDVSDLEATPEAEEGRLLTVRERLEMHRASPACRSCHRVIDPIGLALEYFDGTGARRIKDSGMPIDAQGELYDGTPVTSAADLRAALLARPVPLVRAFTENLLAYALGRRVEYYDMPTVRSIARQAAEQDHRMSAFILGVVNSPAFRLKGTEAVVDDMEGESQGSQED